MPSFGSRFSSTKLCSCRSLKVLLLARPSLLSAQRKPQSWACCECQQCQCHQSWEFGVFLMSEPVGTWCFFPHFVCAVVTVACCRSSQFAGDIERAQPLDPRVQSPRNEWSGNQDIELLRSQKFPRSSIPCWCINCGRALDSVPLVFFATLQILLGTTLFQKLSFWQPYVQALCSVFRTITISKVPHLQFPAKRTG